jgi:WD40 repeat protein
MKQLLLLTIYLLFILFAAELSSAQKPELVVQIGHSDSVLSVAFSPDGNILASSSLDKTVKLWEVSTGTELRTLKADSTFVSFAPDGKSLVSAHNSVALMTLWEVSTGRELRTLEGMEPGFGSDGKTLAGRGPDDAVKLWDIATSRVLRMLKGFTGRVAFSSDGKTFASEHGRTLRLWDISTGAERLTFKGHADWPLFFSPDGKILASAGWDEIPSLKETVRLWDVASGTVLRTIKESTGHVAFSPDGKTLAGENNNGSITIWEISTGRPIRTIEGDLSLRTLAFSPDGKTLASGEGDGVIRLWQVSTGKELRVLKGHANAVHSVVFNSVGKALASTIGETIKLWGGSTGSESRALKVPAGSVAFSPDGKIFATGGEGVEVKLWDVATGTEMRTLKDSTGPVAFSPNGKVLASGGGKNTIKIWEVSTGRQVRGPQGKAFLNSFMLFSPDGKILASNAGDDTVQLWNLSTGALLHTVSAFSETIHSIAFSPDGKILASGNNPQTIKLWRVATGKVLRTLHGDYSDVYSVAFSPDGRILASGGADGLVKLWHVSSGRQLRAFKGHANGVLSVAFSPTGRTLASGSVDGTIKLWDLSSGSELASLMALNENDWIVVTPDGLFDGSPAAWNQLIWRFNRNTLNYAPVESFFGDFYYPGLLEDILSGKQPKAPADLSQKDRRQPRLKITLNDPQADTAVTVRNITVKLDVAELASEKTNKAGSGAQDVRLFRNGSLVKVWRGDVLNEQSSVMLEATVPIVAGANNFTAYAFNRDNIKSADATLTVTGAEGLKRPATAYVLAVGINTYSNPAYNLKYAVADARDFAGEVKRQQELLKRYTQVEVISLSDAEATRTNIIQKLTELATRVQPEDAVIIFFAGHGTAHGKQFYLIPHDLGYRGPRENLSEAGLQTILAHSISDRELEKLFEGIDAGQLLLVIDACNSGQALEAEEKRRGPMNSKGLAQLAYEKGMYVLTAAQSYQAAQEAAKFGHGFLTYALVEDGLKQGKADREQKDGTINLREWLNYATEQVPRMQEENTLDALRGRGRYVVFVGDGSRSTDTHRSGPPRDNIQRPRIFYRREQDADPLVVAVVGASPPK